MTPGTRVRMKESLKAKLRGPCAVRHQAEVENGSCMYCSSGHLAEFGDCVGVVQGPVDYNNCKPGEPGYDLAKIGPEVDVRWEPTNLRYAYASEDLEVVET